MAFGDLQSYSPGKKEPKSTLFDEEANELDGMPESGNVPDIGIGPDCAVTEKMEGRAQRRTCLCNQKVTVSSTNPNARNIRWRV